MPVDMTALVADLAAESAVTRALVAGLDEAGWHTPTPAAGWDIADQISHLAYFDEVTVQSALRPEQFKAEFAEAEASSAINPDAIAVRFRDRSGSELLDWFDTARAELLNTFKNLDPRARLPWFGPAMSAASSLTARIMETWAHSQDIADALGVTREPTDRLRHVAHIGVGARAFSYAVHGKTLPQTPVRVELTGPHGTAWTWGPAEADNLISGPALDFCLLLTQRRHHNDLGRALEGQAEVVAVPALGDQQAEVQRRAAYKVVRLGRTPRPCGAIRAGELDPDRGLRQGFAVHGVAERAGTDADVRHVAQPVRGLTGDAESICDVLAVRPGLHDPGGQRRRGAHGRAEPR